MISDPPDGQMPALTPEAVQRAAAVRAARRGGDGYYTGPFDGPEDLTLYVRCITRGVPGLDDAGHLRQLVSDRRRARAAWPSATRWCTRRASSRSTAGRMPRDKLHSYMGDARGHWEGDTLVVETTNYPREVGVSAARRTG